MEILEKIWLAIRRLLGYESASDHPRDEIILYQKMGTYCEVERVVLNTQLAARVQNWRISLLNSNPWELYISLDEIQAYRQEAAQRRLQKEWAEVNELRKLFPEAEYLFSAVWVLNDKRDRRRQSPRRGKAKGDRRRTQKRTQVLLITPVHLTGVKFPGTTPGREQFLSKVMRTVTAIALKDEEVSPDNIFNTKDRLSNKNWLGRLRGAVAAYLREPSYQIQPKAVEIKLKQAGYQK